MKKMQLNDKQMKCLKAFLGGGYSYIDTVWEFEFLKWEIDETTVCQLVDLGYIAKPLPDLYALTKLGVSAVLPLMGDSAPKARWETPKPFGFSRSLSIQS